MCARFWIICAGAIATSAAYAEAPVRLYLENISLGTEVRTDDAILWRPVVDGISRYQLRLPESSVEDAIKFEDTSALFYMSQKNDPGLQLVRQHTGNVNITITPDHTITTYTHSLTPALSYYVGAQVETENIRQLFGASWRTITGYTQLDQLNAGFDRNVVNFSWTRSELSSDEHSERLYSISSDAGNLQASYGKRWFDLFRRTDVLAEIGIDEASLVIGTQLEHNLGSAVGFVGAVGNLSSGKTNLIMGMRYALRERTEIKATTNTELASDNVQSLKSLRGAALPSHWRRSVHLNARDMAASSAQ